LRLSFRQTLSFGASTVPARLQAILDRALGGRTIAEVIREGEKLERGFLVAFREDLAKELGSEIEKQRRETSDQEAQATQRSDSRIKDLRAEIERLELRLAMLAAATPAPGAH
jgi:predicted RNase H-like nuclease (RuvC/YqgF family)